MDDPPLAQRLLRRGHGLAIHDVVVLAWAERHFRHRRLQAVHGDEFDVALPALVRVDHGDAFELPDGTRFEIIAAEEPLVEVGGPRLALYAWQVGLVRAPCQIEDDRLLIRPDPALEAVLQAHGATLRAVSEPFDPVSGPPAAAPPHNHVIPGAPWPDVTAGAGPGAGPDLSPDLLRQGPFGPG